MFQRIIYDILKSAPLRKAIHMEFNEKLQELRKTKGLTQEDLAQALYVSRTAISKWESGRGLPNIQSLKAIAHLFSVTVDELLSGEELLTLADEETKKTQTHFRDLIFGLLDLSCVILLFLPLFRQNISGNWQGVSLLSLTEINPFMRAAYLACVLGVLLVGILTLALQNCRHILWVAHKSKLSLLLSSLAVALCILGLQPYAAIYLLIFLAIKALVLIKRQ